jgi:hypothetical protein
MSTATHTNVLTEDPLEAALADSIHMQFGRLRTIARIAGLHLNLGHPELKGSARLPLGDISEATARELAALLAEGGDTEIDGIDDAARKLLIAAQTVGVQLRPRAPRTGPDGQALLPLGDIDEATAMRLADLLERRLADLYEVEGAIWAALDAVGVNAEQLSAEGGAICLGRITVPDGVELLRHLVPGDGVQGTAPDDQRSGDDLATRIARAITNVTGSELITADYTPFCRHCESEAAVRLGRLEPAHARALAGYLAEAVI